MPFSSNSSSLPEVFVRFGRIQVLTELLSDDNEHCVMQVTLLPGGVFPIYRSDREVFFVLSGEMSLWRTEIGWQTLNVGDVLDIPINEKHAWKNSNKETVVFIMITTMRAGHFLHEFDRLVSSVSFNPLSSKFRQYFFETMTRHGFWIGTPEENAAIGLSMD